MTGIKNQSQKNPEQNAAKREQRQKQLEQEIREIRTIWQAVYKCRKNISSSLQK